MRHLNEKQVRGLLKLGDAMVPGNAQMPRFSTSGCADQINRILDYMPEQDLSDLKMLLMILSYFPGFAVAVLVRLIEVATLLPGGAGAPFRFIRLGLRGLVMTLYYSNPTVLEKIGYRVGVYLDP